MKTACVLLCTPHNEENCSSFLIVDAWLIFPVGLFQLLNPRSQSLTSLICIFPRAPWISWIACNSKTVKRVFHSWRASGVGFDADLHVLERQFWGPGPRFSESLTFLIMGLKCQSFHEPGFWTNHLQFWTDKGGGD